jgi:DNA-binding MarR family transcriptional regulator
MSKPSEGTDAAPPAGALQARSTSIAAGVTDLIGALVRLWPRETSLTTDFVLAHLERNGPQRLTELADRAGVTQPSMTGLVARLTSSGLVERRTDATDRRVVLVAVSEAGLASIGRRRLLTTTLLAEVITTLDAAHIAALEEALPALQAITGRTEGTDHDAAQPPG